MEFLTGSQRRWAELILQGIALSAVVLAILTTVFCKHETLRRAVLGH